MFIGGFGALFLVQLQSCQDSQHEFHDYARASLLKLTVLETPPVQPSISFTMPDMATPMHLSDYRGKIILVNIWATWCPPCLAEMPTLNKLQAKRGGADFSVIAISMDKQARDAQDWLKTHQITHLTAFHDPALSLLSLLRLQGLPTTLVYDRQGREIARLAGQADWASPEALNFIDALIQ